MMKSVQRNCALVSGGSRTTVSLKKTHLQTSEGQINDGCHGARDEGLQRTVRMEFVIINNTESMRFND